MGKLLLNTPEMRIMVFDINEEDRTVVPLSKKSIDNLIKGLSYAIERAKNREIDVRFYCIVDPDTEITAAQSLQIMEHLRDSGVDVLFTSLDLVVGSSEGGYKIGFNFIGGTSNSGFVKATVAVRGDDDSSEGSEFTGYVEEGLTQPNTF